jgi:hypothetical protein
MLDPDLESIIPDPEHRFLNIYLVRELTLEKDGGTMLAALLCLMEKSLLRRSDCLSSAWEKVLMNTSEV